MKYSDYFMNCLVDEGYTHCFFVAGGNSMHLLESASKRFHCTPVLHEVTASVASEYFNQISTLGHKAFALVTAGPGLTNLVTGIAGAWLDSRELLIVGGQAKSSNLSRGKVRQLGHQEIDGISLVSSITKKSLRIEFPISREEIASVVNECRQERPGPVFIEVCLDVSAMELEIEPPSKKKSKSRLTKKTITKSDPGMASLMRKIKSSQRPLVLLGGGVGRRNAHAFLTQALKLKLPVACTWTGADRVGSDYPYFAGRPNTYGMRWANIFQQQADLLIAVGTSLGFQQTGFNTDEFLPVGELVHVDIDKHELNKPFPKERLRIETSSDTFLEVLPHMFEKVGQDYSDWIGFLSEIRSIIPTLEECQISEPPFISPHEVISYITRFLDSEDCFVTASSGGTFTASMQSFSVQKNQTFLGNKGLASMGYGLAGAIGASMARTSARVILFEGDGGFAQNLQDLGTVHTNKLNIKIFVTSNGGYASIKTSQQNYFSGHYIGCDEHTGLALPDLKLISEAFKIPYMEITKKSLRSQEFRDAMKSNLPFLFSISSDPGQFYLPKLRSSSDKTGKFITAALHDMFPKLPNSVEQRVFRFIPRP